MPDDSKPPNLVELIAKVIAIASAGCLATAFVYDAVFYVTLDHLWIHTLVLADHIETAVATIPFLLVLTAFALFAVWLNRHQRSSRRRLLGAFMASFIGTAIALYAMRVHWPSYIGALGTLGLLAFAGFVAPTRFDFSKDNVQRGILIIGSFWIGFAVMVPMGSALIIRDAGNLPDEDRRVWFGDVVTLKDRGTMTGHVVAVLDRGVLLQTYPALRVHFVPKELLAGVEKKL